MSEQMSDTWDCIVVGGGAAGLSAAITLGRARRRTLLIDAGEQSNRSVEGIGGLLGHDHRPPHEFYATARDEIAQYPSVEIRRGWVVDGVSGGEAFALELEDGSREESKRVLLATGMTYEPPDIPGVAERWGRSVFHCPFCHGWEVRDRALGVLDGGPGGADRALLLRFWSDDVTLYANGAAQIGDADRSRLEAAGVVVDERVVRELRGAGDALDAIVFTDGTEDRCDALLVPAPLRQRSALAEKLGARIVDPQSAATHALAVDPQYRTDVPGLFAAGDVSTSGLPSVASAIASGSDAAKVIVRELVAELYASATPAPVAQSPEVG